MAVNGRRTYRYVDEDVQISGTQKWEAGWNLNRVQRNFISAG